MKAILDLGGFIKEVDVQQEVETILIPILALPGYEMLVFTNRGIRDGKLYYKFTKLANKKDIVAEDFQHIEPPTNEDKKTRARRFVDYLRRIK